MLFRLTRSFAYFTLLNLISYKSVYAGVCTGITDGDIKCINPTSFTICNGGGTIKTFKHNQTMTQLYQTILRMILTNHQLILIYYLIYNFTVFVLLLYEVATPSQNCAQGTKCCGDSCVFPSDALCGNVCSGVPDNNLACVARYSYTVCLNGCK